jgi:hypothetical protein
MLPDMNTAKRIPGPLCDGEGTTVQVWPFQCSTRPAPFALPTAQTSFDESADTPFNSLPFGSMGLATTLQFVPFQCSMNDLGRGRLTGPWEEGHGDKVTKDNRPGSGHPVTVSSSRA